ncbi:hypothetical protein N7456_000327 [Penicillium angulare]|uniref:Uncharacterized protein n=1 Tax=Penicillium angulare TaxID=116970 RepID=A0A9W9GBU0_9EURO|nr:hypothetical protein N7456_000327 [Penicillium angulare]
MECLGIPIDHRLRRVIRETKRIDREDEYSKHIQILHDFGSSLTVHEEVHGGVHEESYPICDLSFALEMARPEVKGGVLVVLERPHSTQNNSEGFMKGVNDCRTLAAVSDLVSAVTNATLRFDDVSVFDAIPFLDETQTNEDIIGQAQDAFADMVRAKNPDVILCCFQTKTQNPLVEALKSRGVGKSFNFNNEKLNRFGVSFTRVNAFHPSYAINYSSMSCCMKQLLVLEFTKAFALWRQNWTEKPWMQKMRDECLNIAKDRDNQSRLNDGWDRPYIKERLEKLLASLDTQFETYFFHKSQDIETNVLQRKLELVNSRITWISCDIASVLEEANDYEVSKSQLSEKFNKWSRKAWPADHLRYNDSNSDGWFDHLPLLLVRSNNSTALERSLENRLFAFLRDLNISFARDRDLVFLRSPAQVSCAFRRFAAAFEDMLEAFAGDDISQGESQLSHGMGHLELNDTATV